MRRLLPFLLLAACDVTVVEPPPDPIDECEGLKAMAVKASPPLVRVNGATTLTATGGSGRYTYSVAMGGSGGEVRGARFVAGPTPAMDTLTASDDCGNTATLTLDVRAAFDVSPVHATVRPGTSFTVVTNGLLGTARYTPQAMASGGSITQAGVYTAGASQGLDLIEVEDLGSGEQAVLQFRVSTTATFRAAPARLAVPAGASVPLGVSDGTGVVTWTKTSGPGTVTGSTFTAADGDTGTAVLSGRDTFTNETTTLSVRVLEELQRLTRPHGRLTDVGNIVTGDFDGDMIQDVAVGVPESDLAKPSGGAVFVFKGSATGLPMAPTWVITGETDTSQLGAVMAAGDLDGDGKDELAISAPGADITGADSGAVFLYRFTAEGPKRMRDPISGLTRNALFGAAIAIADVDGDGDEDLIVGGPGSDLAPVAGIAARGIVDVFLATPGQEIANEGSIRLGGWDTAGDGTFTARTNLRFGRGLAVGDLNGDGRADIASLGAMQPPAGDGGVQRAQLAIGVHFAREAAPRFPERPDLYVLPANLADGDEGNGRLAVVPATNGQPALLMISLERTDSPNLAMIDAGTPGGANAGGALFFDLTGRPATGGTVTLPAFVDRTAAFARIYGDQGGIQAGRSFAVADVDGQPGLELVLGAPYAAGPMNATNAGKLLVYPLVSGVANRPLDSRTAARGSVLGTAVAAWAPGTARGIVSLASRANTQHGDFTGRVDALLGSGPLASWAVTSADLPARVASEQFGLAVRVAASAGKVRALVGAPGYSGPDPNGFGGDTLVGQATAYELGQGASPRLVHEGAVTFYRPDAGAAPRFGGRAAAFDVAFTDFDGDGRQDFAVAVPGFQQPTATNTDYAQLDGGGGCLAGATLGGVSVHTVAADGTSREAFRVWAGAAIAGCDAGSCTRAALSRTGIAGGFDFDNDDKEDLAVTRTSGLEIFSGRGLDDPTLAKLTAACGSTYSLPATPGNTYGPVPLGDLDNDGCDEVAVRYGTINLGVTPDPLQTPNGVVIVFGASAAGACGSHTVPTFLRISGEPEVGLNSMQLGFGVAFAGRVLGDARSFVAISARLYPYLGVAQPTVLLFDVAQLLARRPAVGGVLVGAVGDTLTPIPVMYGERAPQLGRALHGNVDLTGDGVVDLVVGAPGANVNGDGSGAVFVFAGGPGLNGPRESALTLVGDHRERGLFGQDLSLFPGGAGLPATLGVGAPVSYRSGTANGAAFIVPLDF
ncbi:MAG: VCBS repeat-containing protein [Myxococcaceae bacterium]|nr:VCBS repeat-containing protein [Myxococcaceae bacterium]